MIQPHQSHEIYTKWSAQIATAVSTSIQVPDGITSNGTLLDVNPSLSNEKLAEAIVKLGEWDKRSTHQRCLARYGAGRMIMELCARTSSTPEEVIEDTGIAAKLGYTSKTIINWFYVARNIPPSMIPDGVSWDCLSAAAVRLPEDTTQLLAVRQAQTIALEDAATNPTESTGKAVRSRVHEAMEGMGLKPPAPPDKFSLVLEWGLLLRRLRHLDETQDGTADRMLIIEKIEQVETSLINLQIISATV